MGLYESERKRNMKLNKKIFVTFEREGFHCWPEAPKEVEFLRNLHRHLFKFRVELSVSGNNREVEFILLKRELENYVDRLMMDCPERSSCEMLGEDIITYLSVEHICRKVKVEVSEDGENGAVVDNY